MSRAKKSRSEVKDQSIFVYMTLDFKTELEKFSEKHNIPISQLAREGMVMRMSGDTFTQGFNAGLNIAKELIKENKAAAMRFPSGVSIAEYLCEDLDKKIRISDE
jgi:hypothetical protein